MSGQSPRLAGLSGSGALEEVRLSFLATRGLEAPGRPGTVTSGGAGGGVLGVSEIETTPSPWGLALLPLRSERRGGSVVKATPPNPLSWLRGVGQQRRGMDRLWFPPPPFIPPPREPVEYFLVRGLGIGSWLPWLRRPRRGLEGMLAVPPGGRPGGGRGWRRRKRRGMEEEQIGRAHV